jgi:hypothetical protein
MKKIITAFLLLAISLTTFAQNNEQQEPKKAVTRQDFLEKSKSEKRTARGLLIGGGILIATGVLIEVQGKAAMGAGILLGAAGLISAIVSIPVFNASEKSYRKAMAASAYLKMEKASLLQNANITNHSYPSIGIKISL